MCCSPWGCKESDTAQRPNNNNNRRGTREPPHSVIIVKPVPYAPDLAVHLAAFCPLAHEARYPLVSRKSGWRGDGAGTARDYSPFHLPSIQCPLCCSCLCDGGSKPTWKRLIPMASTMELLSGNVLMSLTSSMQPYSKILAG